ncbi:MAG: methyltransferase domain-containing protein [Gammaproteobacteria bacterium]|nr:MAG: methyltransferase domain-containing protein [Gammaproteobacteria bacterium]
MRVNILKSPYDDHPGFYEYDNRKTRTLSPINKEQLENRHAAIFSEWNLKDKSVLDLGSCIGATGQWVLFHGASEYTGVEAQESYVERSRELLCHHGDKCTIVQSSIEEFLANNTRKYDVIVMLGVIYAFLNHHEILSKITEICNDIVVIEGIYPYPPVGNPKAPIIEITSQHPMVLADKEQNIRGVGARISPSALEIIMATLGFEPAGKMPIPKRIKSTLDNFCSDPQEKYFVRYLSIFRNSENICRLLTDELTAPSENPDIQEWRELDKNLPYVEPTKSIVTEKQWEFNEEVANSFENEAVNNIPDYERVINTSINFAEQFVDKNEKVIDVGCALGETLKKFIEAGYTDLYGVDSSAAMLAKAYVDNKIKYIQSNDFPSEQGPFGLITANWTIHFIKQRYEYLENMYKSLKVGGYLILTDKMQLSPEVDAMYRRFKRDRGLSQEYIEYKEEALKEVLVSYPLDWYQVKLREIGFRSVEIINANLSFTTILAKK